MKIDFGFEETKELLKNAPFRLGEINKYTGLPAIEIFINNEWRHLCRTDLYDDVCTFYPQDANLPLDEIRELYSKKIMYGARLKNKPKGFAIIDSATDG